MLALAFDYAIVRVVPRVERGEYLNAGIVLYCATASTLIGRMQLDTPRVAALCSGVDVEAIRRHLVALQRVCDGDAAAGPVAALPVRERFHWLVHPRSAVLQVSDVHTGRCNDLDAAAAQLFARHVARDH